MKLPRRKYLVLIVTVFILVPCILIFMPKSLATRVQQAAKRRWLIMTGGLVNVGGFYLRIDCKGTGSPTVVMDTGLERSRKTWSPELIKEIEKFTRVCTYDRAGLGESDLPAAMPRTSGQMVRELHTLLHHAGESEPFLLVGHSIGGMDTRLYTDLYPQEVAGLVLIDSVQEDQFDTYIKLKPPEERENYVNHLKGANREHMDILASADEIRSAPALPTIPLIVLSSDNGVLPWGNAEKELHTKAQSTLASLIPDSKLIVVEGSGHFIYQDKPEAVVNSIHDIYETTKKPVITDQRSGIFSVLLMAFVSAALLGVNVELYKRRKRLTPTSTT